MKTDLIVKYLKFPQDYSYYTLDFDAQNTIEKYLLYYSKLGEWTTEYKGTKCSVSLKDDGNGVNVKINNKTVRFDYSELEQLLVLLKYREIKDGHQLSLMAVQELK